MQEKNIINSSNIYLKTSHWTEEKSDSWNIIPNGTTSMNALQTADTIYMCIAKVDYVRMISMRTTTFSLLTIHFPLFALAHTWHFHAEDGGLRSAPKMYGTEPPPVPPTSCAIPFLCPHFCNHHSMLQMAGWWGPLHFTQKTIFPRIHYITFARPKSQMPGR